MEEAYFMGLKLQFIKEVYIQTGIYTISSIDQIELD